MRYCILILVSAVSLLAAGISAHAQYNDVYRHGADFYSDGEKLSLEQVCALMDDTDALTVSDIERYQRGFRTGKGLLIGFGSLTGAGLLTLGVGAVGVMVEAIADGVGTVMIGPLFAIGGQSPEISFDSKFSGVAIGGLCATCAGIVGLAAGTGVLCVNKKHLNNVADSCNRTQDVRLSLGVQQYGFGISVGF